MASDPQEKNEVSYRVNPPIDNDALNDLAAMAWQRDRGASPDVDFVALLKLCLCYICAYVDERTVGFVKLVWDGGEHAFLLDTMVHPAMQRRGIGRRLVVEAIACAKTRGVEWVHVDYEPHLEEFYADCGFRPTRAGLINTKHDDWSAEQDGE